MAKSKEENCIYKSIGLDENFEQVIACRLNHELKFNPDCDKCPWIETYHCKLCKLEIPYKHSFSRHLSIQHAINVQLHDSVDSIEELRAISMKRILKRRENREKKKRGLKHHE